MPDDLDMMNEFGIAPELASALRGETPASGSDTTSGGSGTEETPAPGAEQGQGAGAEGGTGGSQTAVEAEPANQPGAGGTPGSEDPVARLTRQLDAQSQQITALTRQLNERQAAQPTGTPGGERQPATSGGRRPIGERVPNYALTVPASIIEGVASDDPGKRAAALTQLSQGIARTVHGQILREMDALEDQIPQRSAQVFRQLDHYRSIFQDFYGNYSKLNDRTFYPIVEQVGKEFFEQNPGQQQWDARARTEIAKRVYARLGWAWTPQVAAQAGAQPVRQVQGGARPGALSTGSEEAQVLDFVTG